MDAPTNLDFIKIERKGTDMIECWISLEKPVNQRILKSGSVDGMTSKVTLGNKMDDKGDIAVLLKGILGGEVLGTETITTGITVWRGSKEIYEAWHPSRPSPLIQSPFNEGTTVELTVEGSKLSVWFEGPRSGEDNLPIRPPAGELDKRRFIKMYGPSDLILRLTSHPRFREICFALRTGRSEDTKAKELAEHAIDLGRPVFQPLDYVPLQEAGGQTIMGSTIRRLGDAAAQGDVVILLKLIFGEFTDAEIAQKTVFRKNRECRTFSSFRGRDMFGTPLYNAQLDGDAMVGSEWNKRVEISVTIDAKRLIAGFETSSAISEDQSKIPPNEFAGRKTITFKGEKALVEILTGHPELGRICEELKTRDVETIRKKLADAERPAKPQGPGKRGTMKVFSAEERRIPGVSPDQGFVGTTFKPNIVQGVQKLRMKEKPHDLPGRRR